MENNHQEDFEENSHAGKLQQLKLILEDCDDEEERQATVQLIAQLQAKSEGNKNNVCPESIPLPPLSINNNNQNAKTVTTTASTDSSSKLATQTRLGKITLQKSKLNTPSVGVGVGKASVFEVDGDGGKEVGLRLQRLRKLKKLQKPLNKVDLTESLSSFHTAAATSTTSEVRKSTIEMRIEEWRNELMRDMSDAYSRKRNKRKAISVVDTKNASIMANSLKETFSFTSTDNGEKVHTQKKMCPSFDVNLDHIMVTAANGIARLSWPIEMVRVTRIAPAINYSVNPLRFNFERLKEISNERDEILVSGKSGGRWGGEESEGEGTRITKNCGWETSSNESRSRGRKDSRCSSRPRSRHHSRSWSSSSGSYSRRSYRSYSRSYSRRRYSKKSMSPSLSRSRSRHKSPVARRRRSKSNTYSRSRSKSRSKYRSKSRSKYRTNSGSKYRSKTVSRSKKKKVPTATLR